MKYVYGLCIITLVFTNGNGFLAPYTSSSPPTSDPKVEHGIVDLLDLLMEEKAERQKLEQDLLQLKQEMLKQHNTTSNGIGFTVRFATDGDHGGILKFDYPVSNYGNRYNKATGKFVCNKAGLYLFNLHLVTTTTGFYADVVKNGAQLARAHVSYDGDNHAWDSGSVSAVSMMDVGDEAWVVGIGSADGTGSSAHFSMFSFFTGAFISF